MKKISEHKPYCQFYRQGCVKVCIQLRICRILELNVAWSKRHGPKYPKVRAKHKDSYGVFKFFSHLFLNIRFEWCWFPISSLNNYSECCWSSQSFHLLITNDYFNCALLYHATFEFNDSLSPFRRKPTNTATVALFIRIELSCWWKAIYKAWHVFLRIELLLAGSS